MITYEYPLNERIRTLLRLEDLFERSRYFVARHDALDHHVALLTLFEILEVASRADLKSDLLQELERQKQVLLSFRNNPEISEEVLSRRAADIEQASAALFTMTGKIGQYLRENEWLMSIKQRTGIPGGVCEFDLPSYHYWLHRQAGSARDELAAWTKPLYPLRDASAIVLRICCASAASRQRIVAQQGLFQQMLGGTRRRWCASACRRAPLHAGNQRQQVRAQHPLPDAGRASTATPQAADWDVPFELTFCNL